jgi:heme exporter protein A
LVREFPDLELQGVARRFGRRWVLRGADLRVAAGTVVALTGRNGSGKTTLLRICAPLLRPTRGTARILGHDLIREADRIREFVGVLAHEAGLYDNLTAEENLLFSLRMAGLAPDRTAVGGILEIVGLAADRTERVRGFSAGMRRRLGLARLMLRPPRLLLLDEPYASFDADGIDLVNAFARQVSTGGGITMIATHDLARAEAIMDRRIRVVDGRLIEGADIPEDDLIGAGQRGSGG